MRARHEQELAVTRDQYEQKLAVMRAQIEKAKGKVYDAAVRTEPEAHTAAMRAQHEQELAVMRAQFEERLAVMREEIKSLKRRHKNQIDRCADNVLQALLLNRAEMQAACEAKVAVMRDEHSTKIDTLMRSHASQLQTHQEHLSGITAHIAQTNETAKITKTTFEETQKELNILRWEHANPKMTTTTDNDLRRSTAENEHVISLQLLIRAQEAAFEQDWVVTSGAHNAKITHLQGKIGKLVSDVGSAKEQTASAQLQLCAQQAAFKRELIRLTRANDAKIEYLTKKICKLETAGRSQM
jgi:hypothetical protein